MLSILESVVLHVFLRVSSKIAKGGAQSAPLSVCYLCVCWQFMPFDGFRGAGNFTLEVSNCAPFQVSFLFCLLFNKNS